MNKAKSGTPAKSKETEEPKVAEAKEESRDGAGVGSDVRPSRPAEGRFEGHRSATVNLPFLTAQVRLPDLRVPSRDDLGAAASGVQRKLPSGKALLFYGGLTASAVLGAIEWPVAAAIGVGSALASRGGADPRPRETTGPGDTGSRSS